MITKAGTVTIQQGDILVEGFEFNEVTLAEARVEAVEWAENQLRLSLHSSSGVTNSTTLSPAGAQSSTEGATST